MRTVRRPRHYVSKHWLVLFTPVFGYNYLRDAYVLRGIGRHVGPVLRPDRRMRCEQQPGVSERRRMASWA